MAKKVNILFFLLPKNNVEYVYDNYSIRQVLEKMDFHRYSAIPIISKDGKYVGTISEGDILMFIKHQPDTFDKLANINILSVPRYRDTTSIKIDKNMDDLVTLIYQQNFVPVVDDYGSFIGIITRKKVIEYLISKINSNESDDDLTY